MPLLSRKRLLLTKIESSYGTDSSPGGTDAVLVRNLEITPIEADTVSRDLIRPYLGHTPVIPESCYVDISAQVIGDVVLGENSSIWMNAVVRGDVHSIRIGSNSNVQDCSVLLVEQNALGALAVSARGYIITGGRIRQSGTPSEILADEMLREAFLGPRRARDLAVPTPYKEPA